MSLHVGVGREAITPRVGGRLFGYQPNVFSESVHDDLTVTAVAVASGGVKMMIVSATVCVINTELTNGLRAQIGEQNGIPAENVLLCATHTHSGPCLKGMVGWGDDDAEYRDGIFIPGCLKAAAAAAGSLAPARMGVGRGESLVGINRRELRRDGSVVLGQNPWAPYDPAMTVVAFVGEGGKPIANIVHCSAHCTAAGMNHEVTRDWAGVMIDRLDKESGAVTMFINGAIGDTGPRLSNGHTTGDINYVVEIGSLAALDATRIYKGIKQYGDADCGAATGEIRIGCGPLMPLEDAERELATYAEAPPHNIMLARYSYLKEVIAAHKGEQAGDGGEGKYWSGGGGGCFSYPQTLLRVGGVVFIPLQFEFFAEISLRIRAYGQFQDMLSISCANGHFGYLPTQDQLVRGGYEVQSFRLISLRPLPDDTDGYIVDANLKIAEKL